MVSRPEWWPPADGEVIGDERAHELVAYLRERAPLILEIVRQHLGQLYPGQKIQTYAASAKTLAKMTLEPHMTHMTIGTVYVGQAGTTVQVTIGLMRNGAVVADLSRPTDTVRRWVSA